jgi:hypothetical protein
MKQHAINTAIKFLVKRGYPIPLDILQMNTETKSNEDMLIVAAYIKRSIKQGDGYATIRNQFWSDVYDNVYDYLSEGGTVTAYKNRVVMSLSKAYIEASEEAWVAGGAELPIDEDTASWGRAEIQAQLSYVDKLFETLKQLRKEEDVNKIQEGFDRADGYADALDSFFNYIKTAAFGGKMLTFVGSDGRESCKDCKRLKGQRRRASWWTSHDLVPPSRNFECGGYNCDHYLVDDAGNVFTV